MTTGLDFELGRRVSIYLLLAFSLGAYAQPTLSPNRAKFLEICRAERAAQPITELSPPEPGVQAYFPVARLEASQTRYSHSRFLESLRKAVTKEPPALTHDHGQSVYGLEKRVTAAYYRGKFYIIDGHHRALISIYLGAKTIPLKVEADLSHLEFREFREQMEARGWAHWRDYQGRFVDPVDLCEMADDPNFQLARLIIHRVDVTIEDGQLLIQNSRGAERPVAIKINNDIPFFENHIADALRRAGFEWSDGRTADDLGKDELSAYLEALKSEGEQVSSPLAKVLLLDKPRNVAKLELDQLVLTHLRKCERELRP